MPSLSLWLTTARVDNDAVVDRLAIYDVVVLDLGSRPESVTRALAIGQALDEDSEHLLHLRLIVGPDGGVCAYRASDLTQDDQYNEFDVLLVDLHVMYEGLGHLIRTWRARGHPARHIAAVPFKGVDEDEDT